MTAQPSVSVVMSARDSAGTIEATLRTLIEQTHRPAQIIVVNDGSTDQTGALIARFAQRHPDVVTSVDQNPCGVPWSLNMAVAMAVGDFIAIADSDDLYTPDRLAVSIELMNRTDADLVGGQVVGGLGRLLALNTSRFPTDAVGIADRVRRGFDPLPHTTMMLRASSVDRFGAYRDVVRAADLELMLRWGRQGARIEVSPHVLAWHRLRREHLSLSQQTSWMQWTAHARQVSQFEGPPGPGDAEPPSVDTAIARAEARRRVARLAVRLAVGTLDPRRFVRIGRVRAAPE